MQYKLGTNVQIGNKILTKTGWNEIVAIKEDGAETPAGFIEFGKEIFGWKIR